MLTRAQVGTIPSGFMVLNAYNGTMVAAPEQQPHDMAIRAPYTKTRRVHTLTCTAERAPRTATRFFTTLARLKHAHFCRKTPPRAAAQRSTAERRTAR
jgi:hypothetical protein